jgi:4-aminobutyrate aminotransferase-like enzyme
MNWAADACPRLGFFRLAHLLEVARAEMPPPQATDFYNEPLTDLAEKLSAIAPMPGPHKFFYGNSGAEAVECALMFRLHQPQRFFQDVQSHGGFLFAGSQRRA